jgi:hypothetical protein
MVMHTYVMCIKLLYFHRHHGYAVPYSASGSAGSSSGLSGIRYWLDLPTNTIQIDEELMNASGAFSIDQVCIIQSSPTQS